MIGGLSETDKNELTVQPIGCCSLSTVETIATPVGKWLAAARSCWPVIRDFCGESVGMSDLSKGLRSYAGGCKGP